MGLIVPYLAHFCKSLHPLLSASRTDLRRLISHLATTPAVRLRFKPVAALCWLPACFFDGLALLFELFGLLVGLSLSRGGGVCLFLGCWGFQQGLSVSPWRKPLLTLLILLFGWLGLCEWLRVSCCLCLATALKSAFALDLALWMAWFV